MRSLLPPFLLIALSTYASFLPASGNDLDTLGCHNDPITDSYHCHSGLLEGREFMGPDDAAAALKISEEQNAKDKEEEEFAASYTVPLKMLSWDFATIGTKRFEYDRIATILADADFVVLQDVEFSKTGETSLTVIADLLAEKSRQRICKGWFKSAAGERGRHAFLWKDKIISYVEKNGTIEDRCPDAPVVIRTEGKKISPDEALIAAFFLKSRRQMFNAVAVKWAKKPKKPAKEITALFERVGQLPWPTVVAGNFKVSPEHKDFRSASAAKFKTALKTASAGTANLWTKNLSIVNAQIVDLAARFPELKPREVDAMISDLPPVLADISFTAEEAEALKMQLIKRNDKKAKSMRKEASLRKAAERPVVKPLPVHDDLEQEAED